MRTYRASQKLKPKMRNGVAKCDEVIKPAEIHVNSRPHNFRSTDNLSGKDVAEKEKLFFASVQRVPT